MYVLIRQLPPESALARSVHPERAEWRTQEELLAGLIETVDQGNRYFFQANFKGSPPKPVEIKRPYPREEVKSSPRELTTEDLAKMLGPHNEN